MSALASSSSAALRPTVATPPAAPLPPSPSICSVSLSLIFPRPGSFPGAARTSVAFRAVGKNNENGSSLARPAQNLTRSPTSSISLASLRPRPRHSFPRSRCDLDVSIQENRDSGRKKKSAPRSLHDRHRVPAARDRADRSKTQTRAWRVAMVSVCRGGGAGPRVV